MNLICLAHFSLISPCLLAPTPSRRVVGEEGVIRITELEAGRLV